MNENQGKRIIGLDMHPDVYAAAALSVDPKTHHAAWVQDRMPTAELEAWAAKRLIPDDVVVLEASGNSFEVAARLHAIGFSAVVLESAQAGKIRDNFCNDDRHSAVKLAKVYRSGLAKEVWQPTATTREHREVFFAHRNAVKDATRCRNRIHCFLNEHCVRLKRGVRLTTPSGEAAAQAAKPWSALQADLIAEAFEQLRQVEARRKKLERIMVRELVANPGWARLWRLMGIRHRVAFGLMAMVGDVHRFPTAKKLVGYLGLAPRKTQSGNDAKGRDGGMGKFGRGDVRGLLIQSAQNALTQRNSPWHHWGWKLMMKKHRNEAVAAVARKITVSVWHLLMGHFTPLLEVTEHLRAKLLRLATVIGKDGVKALGFENRDAFVSAQIQSIQLST